MKQVALTTIKGGLSRQRTKGGALKDALFDLLNGYVTTEKTVKSRPGTTLDETLPAGTTGLVFWDGAFQVFASDEVSNIPAGYNLNILRAPDGEELSRIHFAKPFMGALYVAAEFADGDIYHYWLQAASTWAADTDYDINELVEPSTPNGYVYRATRLNSAFPVWTAGTTREVGDIVEPTTFNGLYYEVTTVTGSNPRSGDTEPDWGDAEVGELFTESPDGTAGEVPDPTPSGDPAQNTLPLNIARRYEGRGYYNEP